MSDASTTNRSTASASKKSSCLVRALIGLVVLAGVGMLLWMFVAFFGVVSGEEFSPETFTRRRFRYFEIPVVGIQIWPLKRDTATNPLERHLIALKFIQPASSDQIRYDLVKVSRGHLSDEGDAAILCRYLDSTDTSAGLTWLKWTKKHPKLAKVLWPAVAEVSRKQLYILAPDLFDLARSAAGAAALKQTTKKLLTRKYQQLADAQQALENHQTAVDLYTAALSHSPGDEEILQRRNKSRQALGELQQSTDDQEPAPESST